MAHLPLDLPPLPAYVTRGTLIDTYHGPLPVEDLVTDDLIMTKDGGFQPVRWIGSVRAEARGRLAPVRISAGTHGNNRSLLVSQHHLILLNDWRAELLFGTREVLAPARALVNDETIWVQEGGVIDYYALLMTRHEIIYTEEAFSGSFHPDGPGCEVMGDALNREMRAAVRQENFRHAARPILKPYEVRALRSYAE